MFSYITWKKIITRRTGLFIDVACLCGRRQAYLQIPTNRLHVLAPEIDTQYYISMQAVLWLPAYSTLIKTILTEGSYK